MTTKPMKKLPRRSAPKPSVIQQIATPVLDVLATFGSNNTVRFALPVISARKELRKAIRAKYRSVTKAVVTYPDLPEPVILPFSRISMRNLT